MTLADFGSEFLSAWMGSINDSNCWEGMHVLTGECTSPSAGVKFCIPIYNVSVTWELYVECLLQYSKNSPFPQENQATFPKMKAHGKKDFYQLLSVTQTWKQTRAATFTQTWLSTQWFPNKIICVASATKTISTTLPDGMLWIKCWHKTQTYHSVLSWHQNLFPCFFSPHDIYTRQKKIL